MALKSNIPPCLPANKKPRGAKRTTPTQGRATFTMSVLRWQARGGVYCPPPSPRGLPPSIQIGCFFPSATLREKSFINRSKGGKRPPARCRGPGGRKKREHPCSRFFLPRAASCRPAPPFAATGRTMPARLVAFILPCVLRPTASQKTKAFPRLRNDKFSRKDRRTASGPAAASPASE
jgi:hypothetical protein